MLEIVRNCSLKEAAAKSIVDMARKRWKRKEYAMEAKTDDCAVICHFLHESLDPMHSSATSDKQSLSVTSMKHIVSARCQKPKPLLKKSETPMYVSHEIKNRGKQHELLETIEGEKWNALDGVTRVNTLVKLPPFFPKSS